MSDVVLKVENVSKYYPGVQALKNVSLNIKAGEVRALVGENGAGKSTLIKCIMGIEKYEEGEVLIRQEDKWIRPESAIHAQSLGLYANYQHVNIAGELSVAENYFMGKLPVNCFGAVDWKEINRECRKVLDKFNMDIDPEAKIYTLSTAMQSMVTISKISTNNNLRLVIFDEPTALLENDKVDILYRYIRELKSQGVSVIYISHRLEEVMEICDTVTVLKDGRYVDTRRVEEINSRTMINLMVGRDLKDIFNIRRHEPGEELLRVENLSREPVFRDVSFRLRAGEIVGFFGLIGAGRSEVMRCIFGADKKTGGSIFIRGKKCEIRSPMDAMRHHIGLIPEDRRTEGLAQELPVRTNINMSSYDLISKWGMISLKKEAERASEYVEKTGIKTPGTGQLVRNLSGGNQQKVVISKLLCRDPDIFIFDEPTVGVDVGAKEEIYKLIGELTALSKGVIIISSYLPEVMGLSDRMIVMAEGRIAGEAGKEELKTLEEKDILTMISEAG